MAETRPPRPVPAVPDPTPVLAVPETAPTPPAADIVASAEAPPEVPGPIAASEVIESAQPAPPTAPARATADALPGNPDDVRNYLAAVMRQLNRYKTYPRALKKARIEGTVVIQFTIDHDGQLLASAVQQGSGQADLDRAALDMLARANPLPAIPDFMNRDELALAIPVEYSLITDR
ncbi:MAG: energy transducer TonB [Steroidobacteraceae bacterium]|nr:energy transducer TonB [Steroidobacteraceae bacterium]